MPLQQLIHAQDYIAQENPIAARAVAQRIVEASTLVLKQPKSGRPGRIQATREWVVKQTPYLLVYSLEADEVWIISVIHSKQDWPDSIE